MAAYYREEDNDHSLAKHLGRQIAEVLNNKDYLTLDASMIGGTLLIEEGKFLYVLTRALRPQVIIETGVANGISSAYFLTALDRNGQGVLHSIDLPFSVDLSKNQPSPLVDGTAIEETEWSPIPPDKEPGWLVPRHLWSRWNLVIDDVKHGLKGLLEQVPPIDIFFHDSAHNYEHMLFEFRTVFPFIRDRGVLLADDIFLRGHSVFPDFARSVGTEFLTYDNLGAMVKGSE